MSCQQLSTGKILDDVTPLSEEGVLKRRKYFRWLLARKGLNLDCSCGRATTKVFELEGENFPVSSCERCLLAFIEEYSIDRQRIRFKHCQHGKCGVLADWLIREKEYMGLGLALCRYHEIKFGRSVSKSIRYAKTYLTPALDKEELSTRERIMHRALIRRLKREGVPKVAVVLLFGSSV